MGQKQDYIDAVRGWAILMVMTTHVGKAFVELPWAVKRFTNPGWHGVQLFFLASAVTLLMSWHRSRAHDARATRSFFLRRFLRIAPMYYAGALLYAFAQPPSLGFDAFQLLRTLLFVNVWRPDWVPTTPGWLVVPGGWSIGVEFTFYAVFPVLAAIITTLPRALALVAVSVAIAVTANTIGTAVFGASGEAASANFLYFWFPNQLPVFSIGFVLYFLIDTARFTLQRRTTAYMLLAGVAISWSLVTQMPTASAFFTTNTLAPPLLLVSVVFSAFVLILARGPATLLTHPLVRRIGVLSFSTYVLHFLVIDLLPAWSFGLIDVKATGYAAIANFIVLWVLTVAVTALVAAAAHAWIEQPGIELARRLTVRRTPRPVHGG